MSLKTTSNPFGVLQRWRQCIRTTFECKTVRSKMSRKGWGRRGLQHSSGPWGSFCRNDVPGTKNLLHSLLPWKWFVSTCLLQNTHDFRAFCSCNELFVRKTSKVKIAFGVKHQRRPEVSNSSVSNRRYLSFSFLSSALFFDILFFFQGLTIKKHILGCFRWYVCSYNFL